MRKPVLAVLLVVAAGCAGLQEFARSAFQEPKLTFRSASIQALDLEGATVAFLFDLSNPNAVGVDVARGNWAVEVDQTRVVAGNLSSGLTIPANGTAPVSFPVRVRFRDVPGIVSLLGSHKEDLPYHLSGAIGVRTPVGVIDLPFSHTDRVHLPRMPQFAVEGLAIRNVSFSSVGLAVRLRVKNPNGFPLPPGAMDYALAVGGSHVARAEGARIDAVPGGASAIVEIPVRVELASAGRAATALVQGGDVDVQLTGKADLAGLPLPLDLKARVPARR